jgi:hypothetical protein
MGAAESVPDGVDTWEVVLRIGRPLGLPPSSDARPVLAELLVADEAALRDDVPPLVAFRRVTQLPSATLTFALPIGRAANGTGIRVTFWRSESEEAVTRREGTPLCLCGVLVPCDHFGVLGPTVWLGLPVVHDEPHESDTDFSTRLFHVDECRRRVDGDGCPRVWLTMFDSSGTGPAKLQPDSHFSRPATAPSAAPQRSPLARSATPSMQQSTTPSAISSVETSPRVLSHPASARGTPAATTRIMNGQGAARDNSTSAELGIHFTRTPGMSPVIPDRWASPARGQDLHISSKDSPDANASSLLGPAEDSRSERSDNDDRANRQVAVLRKIIARLESEKAEESRRYNARIEDLEAAAALAARDVSAAREALRERDVVDGRIEQLTGLIEDLEAREAAAQASAEEQRGPVEIAQAALDESAAALRKQVEALLEAQSLADKTTAPDWVQEDVRSEALWRELTSLRKRQEASDAEAQDTAARADAAQRRAHAEVAALEAERDDAIQEVTALRESLMAREAESAGMRKRVASLLDERTGAYAELDALRRELHARDVEVLNATQAREEAEVAMREAEQAKQAQAKDARRQLDELRRTWTHHLKSIEARVDKDNDAHRDEVADMKMQLAAEQSHVEALTAANAAALKPPRDRQGLIALWRRAVLHASGSFEAAWEDLLRAPGPRGTVNRASFDRYVETRLGLPPQGAIAQAIWVAIGGSSNGVIVFEDLAREDSISYRPTPRIRPDAARVSPRVLALR